MSGERVSLRGGLPYGWWKRGEFWAGLFAWGSALGGLALLTFIVLLWWGLLP